MYFIFYDLQSMLHVLQCKLRVLQFTFHDLQLKFDAKIQKFSEKHPRRALAFSHSFPFFNFYFAGSLAFFLNFAPENKLLSI